MTRACCFSSRNFPAPSLRVAEFHESPLWSGQPILHLLPFQQEPTSSWSVSSYFPTVVFAQPRFVAVERPRRADWLGERLAAPCSALQIHLAAGDHRGSRRATSPEDAIPSATDRSSSSPPSPFCRCHVGPKAAAFPVFFCLVHFTFPCRRLQDACNPFPRLRACRARQSRRLLFLFACV